MRSRNAASILEHTQLWGAKKELCSNKLTKRKAYIES